MHRDPAPRPKWGGRRSASATGPVGVLAALAVMLLKFPPAFLAPKVETTTVQLITPAQASTVLTATGYTVADRRASVAAKVVGRVVELRVDEGDPVRKGQVIALLDSE